MEDSRSQHLKANYNQEVLGTARKVYLKLQEGVRDLNEAKIRDEEKNAIRLHMIGMITANRPKS